MQPRAEPRLGRANSAGCPPFRGLLLFAMQTLLGAASFHVPANMFVEMFMMFHPLSLQGKHWVTANKVVMARVGSLAR